MTVPVRVSVLILLAVVSMTSCGMQGDLYLPEEKAETNAEQASKNK